MSVLKLSRKTISGSTPFSFDVSGDKFLVKNFTDGDVYINIEAITNANQADSVKLPKGTAQIFTINEKQVRDYSTIYVSGTGEVEVQVVSW